jgi:hypothetical protein
MRREGRCHFRRQDSSDPGTVTKPTTTADSTQKIKPSSATELMSTAPIVGVRNDGQHSVRVMRDSHPPRDARWVECAVGGRSGRLGRPTGGLASLAAPGRDGETGRATRRMRNAKNDANTPVDVSAFTPRARFAFGA